MTRPRSTPRLSTAPARFASGLLVCLLLVLAVPAAAQAEFQTITAQARAANAEWLPWAPPPPGRPAAVCLIDTGVDLNPDTETNVIERIALDGGDGGNASPSNHGTHMAMAMGAPVNDWGMVGAWPLVRIVSVRAAERGRDTFPFGNYARAIQACQDRAPDLGIKVIALALGGDDASVTVEEQRRLQDYVRRARHDGMNVVAAGGNHGGLPNLPAALDPVFSVGASNSVAALCTFSALPTDVTAPGCGLDGATALGGPTVGGEGTSQASVFVASILAALRSYRPDLDPKDAEALVASSSVAGLDVAATFRSVSLDWLVTRGSASAPHPAPTVREPEIGQGLSEVSVARSKEMPKPIVRVRARSGGRTLLEFLNRPSGATVVVTVVRKAGEFRMRSSVIKKRTSRVIVRRAWVRLGLAYRNGFWTSRAISIARSRASER